MYVSYSPESYQSSCPYSIISSNWQCVQESIFWIISKSDLLQPEKSDLLQPQQHLPGSGQRPLNRERVVYFMGRLANKLKFEQEDKYILKWGQIHFATGHGGWCILWEGLPNRKQTKAVQNAWSSVYGGHIARVFSLWLDSMRNHQGKLQVRLNQFIQIWNIASVCLCVSVPTFYMLVCPGWILDITGCLGKSTPRNPEWD